MSSTSKIRVLQKFTQINHRTVHFLEAGDPSLPKLLLLHTWPSTSQIYYPSIKILAAKFHVFAPDFPGFGLSDEPDSLYSYDTFTVFIRDFMDHQKITKTNLLGVSLGAALALKFAHQYPQRIGKLILNSPPVDLYSKHRLIFKLLIKFVSRYPLFTDKIINSFKKGRILNIIHTLRSQKDSVSPLAYQQFLESTSHTNNRAIIETMKEILTRNLNQYLTDFPNLPTLLLVGQNEYLELQKDMDYLAKTLPQAEYQRIAGGDHHMLLHKYYPFARTVINFLETAPKSTKIQ